MRQPRARDPAPCAPRSVQEQSLRGGGAGRGCLPPGGVSSAPSTARDRRRPLPSPVAPAVLEPGRSEAEHRSEGRSPILPERTARMDSHPAAQRPSPGHQPWRGLGEPLSLHRGLRRWPHLLTPSDSEGPVPVRASLVSGDGHPLGSALSPLGRSRRPTDTLPSWLSSVISAFRPLTAGQRPQATRETSATHPLAQIPTEALGPSLQAYPEGSGWFSWHRGPPTFGRGPVLEADSRHKSESRLRTREVTPRRQRRGVRNRDGARKEETSRVVGPSSPGTDLRRGEQGAPHGGEPGVCPPALCRWPRATPGH